jgi:folate-dependent phosphoribosylglycinamide formyltransferase PurN
MRTALLISGSGTTATAIVQAVQNGKLSHIKIVGVISSRAVAKGVGKMQTLGVRVKVIDPKKHSSQEKFGEKLLDVFHKWRVELISQNGWIPLTPQNVIHSYKNKIINQHPGPLDPGHPDFGGKSMYGSRVTCARIAYCWLTHKKNPWTEATSHWVSEGYDKGDLIKIKRLQLPATGSNVSLQELTKNPKNLIDATHNTQKKLLPLEHTNVIETLRLISLGKTKNFTRKKRLISPHHLEILRESKQLAKQLFPAG